MTISRMLRGLAFIGLGVAVLSAVFTPLPAAAKYASLVMDAETGRIVHSVNSDTRNYPASLTKMMTLYLIFDALKKGELSLEDRFDVSARAARQPSSRLGLKKGDSFSVETAILALAIKSANDVASAVSENMAKSERDFALKMTAKARQLGMSRTIFRNASGLPHRGQQSTARDMAILAQRLLKDFPDYYHYFGMTEFTHMGKRHRTHNKLLKSYDGADGIKTGYIRASGFNLVASVKRHGHRLIGVVFGSRSPRQRSQHMTSLLDKGFRTLVPQLTVAERKQQTKVRNHRRIIKSRKGRLWGVQVGAVNKYDPAFEIARKAVSKAPGLLAAGTIKVVPLQKKNGRTVYRARILGIGKRDAYQACRILKKRSMHCMPLTVKPGIELAAAGN